MFRQARSINSAQRQIVAQRNIIRRYAIDSPSIPASTAGSLPPKPPTPLVAGSSRPVTPIIGNPVPVGSSTTTPTPPVVGVAPIPAKPVVVVNTTNANKVAPIPTPIPTTGGSGLPPPPPPPPQKPKSRWARKFLIYLTLGTLVFYPTSAFISTKSDRYRDFFTSSFPLAEGLVDYADENDWDELSVSKVVSGAKGLTSPNATTTSTGPATTSSTGSNVSETTRRRVDDAKKAVESGTKQAGKTLNEKIEAVQHKAAEKLDAAKAALTPSSSPTTIATAPTTTTDPTIRDRDVAVERKASELKREAKKAAEKTSESASKAAEGIKQGVQRATETVKQKADELVAKLPEVNVPAFSEGVTDLVAKAENALGRAEDKAGNALNKVENRVERAVGKAEHEVEKAEDKVKGALRNKGGPVVDPAVQAQMVDTQRPRDVKANPASNKPVLEKKPWTGAPLPLGFEPPAGYYLAKTPGDRKDVSAVTDADAKKDPMVAPNPKTEGVPVNKPTLPLLAPRVAEFTSAEQEPIIAQLANTIDSLASSLSPTSSTKGAMSDDADPEHVLSRAQTDLTSLSARLQSLKDKEQANLQDLAEKKKREFEVELKNKESEWNAKEGQMVEGWEKEREKLVEGWRKVLDRELEGQRVGIEQRLREEVIAQGIELQRRWLRSIKAQVEEERGGRLSKLDNLTTSFKQLERITLDNSSQLDANVSLHTLWSALRAVQAKVDKGGVAFDDELRVLKTAATAAASTASDEQSKRLIATVIESIEQSHAATEGIKSFPALSSWFSSTLAPKIQSVSLVPAEHEAGVLSHLASAGLSKVLFRPRAGWVEGSDVGAVLARAEYLLNEKDLDGAAREVNQLQGWAGKLAGDWLREARKRLEVEQALQVLATEATLSSLLLV